ncbi:MAG: hypothetical protein ACRCX2_14380 [Paraclostridium sp.]
MEVLTYVSPVTGVKKIDGPTNVEDFDKYYKWLMGESNQWNMSVSDNLKDFKKEFIDSEGELVPTVINIDELEEVESANMQYILEYNKKFNEYFTVVKGDLQSK